jgi:hypothetical protein
MNVLVACECSGRVKTAFRNKGHNAWSCDLKSSEISDDKFHYQCDVREVLNNSWDLLIAHPDCTYLCNSGVCWLSYQPTRFDSMILAAQFFKFLLSQPVPKITVENPIPHKYALEYIGQKYTQIIQPNQFGEDASKATCLWLKGLPKLRPTGIILPSHYKVSKSGIGRMVYANQTGSGRTCEPPGPERKANRARTYQGIANAMAEQWG